MHISRRELIAGAAAGAGASATWGGGMARAAEKAFFQRTGLPLGLQLYTLGPDLAADIDGQLGQVAKAGYRTVELAGYAGKTPAEFRAALDKAGLSATSSHVGAASNKSQAGLDNVDGVIAEARILGVRHIVLPMFPMPTRFKPAAGEDMRAFLARVGAGMTADDWKATGDLLNAKAKPLKAAGLTLGYHNHNVEFAPVGGTNGLAILLAQADPALVQFEMDAGWVVAGGHDPAALLEAHRGRFTQMHVKDVAKGVEPNFAFKVVTTEIGNGVIDWPRLLAAADKAGVREYFVEHEPPFARPVLEMLKTSFDNLVALRTA